MTDQPSSSINAGMMLGHYRITRAIGAGGMGEVYEAQDTRLNRVVAVKVVRRELAHEPARRARLESEARATARLNHPHIVTLYSLEESAGLTFLTMELVSGRTLRETIPAGGFSAATLLQLAIQLTDAVAAAHGAGLTHGDLTPANIMVAADGGLKILDFGLAKSDVPPSASSATDSLSGAHGMVGTVAYLAPEVLEGRSAGPVSDMYSLGAVLFEMATGRRPFEGTTPFKVMSGVLRDQAPRADAVNPSVPHELAELIDRCLAKSPSSRRQSAADLRDDLERLGRRMSSPTSPLLPGGDAASSEPPAAPSTDPAMATTPADGRASRHRATWRLMAGAAGVIAVVVAFLAPRDSVDSGRQGIGTYRSLAILPLVDHSEDPAQAYFADGLTEELITRVARIPGLRVVPRMAVAKYRGGARSLPQIASELGVDAILDGTLLRDPARVRLNVNLVDARTRATLWAESYDRALRDVLALHSELALEVAAQLRVTLTPVDEARMSGRQEPVNPVAYDAYLRGLTLVERVNRVDMEAAVRTLERAVELAPSYADAWGTLALAYIYVYGSYVPHEAAALELKAQAAIARALALDPDSAEAHLARGVMLWDGAHGWPHEESAKSYRAALTLKPSLDPARRSLSTVYNHIGLADASLATLAESPETPAVLFQKGLAVRVLGDIGRARTHWQSIPVAARNSNHIGHLVWSLADLGQVDEAQRLLDDTTARGVEDVNGMLAAGRARLAVQRGERALAAQLLAAATARAVDTRESHHATYVAATAYARLGDRDRALQWLRFTAANGFPAYPLMAGDASLALLRSDPRFVDFLAESKVRWANYRSRLGNQVP